MGKHIKKADLRTFANSRVLGARQIPESDTSEGQSLKLPGYSAAKSVIAGSKLSQVSIHSGRTLIHENYPPSRRGTGFGSSFGSIFGSSFGPTSKFPGKPVNSRVQKNAGNEVMIREHYRWWTAVDHFGIITQC